MRLCNIWAELVLRLFLSRSAWIGLGIITVIGFAAVPLSGCDDTRTFPVESPKPLRSGRQPAPIITIIEKT